MMKFILVVGFSFFFSVMSGSLLSLIFYVCIYLILCFFLLFNYSMNLGGSYWILISGYVSCDSYSYYLILLSMWIVSLMMLTLVSEEAWGVEYKKIVFNLVLILLVMFFSVFNLMSLYFFFEVSLIPTFLIVLWWGGNRERMEAAFFLLMYMMFISFPFLAYLIKIYLYNLSLDLGVMVLEEFNEFSSIMCTLDLLVLLGAFLIKLPMYLFHIWLPKAHVEAPVYGSMLLAAVLLKLGGYGLLRVTVLFVEQCLWISSGLMSLGLVGSLYISVLCLLQVDMKSLVAYSSVVHMNFMLGSLITMTTMGVISAFLVMVSHGLCSSGLFYMVNLFYKRSFSRLIVLNRGALTLVPFFSLWWFFLCSSNFAFPLSLNFIGEIMMIMVIMGWSVSLMVILGLISFFSGAYSVYLFSVIYHGDLIMIKESMETLNSEQGEFVCEHLSLFMHYYPLLLILINLFIFMN